MAGVRAGGQGGRRGHTAYVDEVYERNDAAQDARMEERFQQLEQQMEEAFGALTDQIVALSVGGNLPHYCSVQPRFPKEEEVSDDVSITNPLAGNHPTRGRTMMNEATIEWPFTSNIIPDPIVDWSKPPVFDEELVENITKGENKKIIKKVVTVLEDGEVD